MKKPLLVPRRRRASLVAGALLLSGAVLSQGCLQRDVAPQEPNTSNVFVDEIQNQAINEIDLLFVIDNSVSMADKQAILKEAVPQMVQRLIDPGCKDPSESPPDCQKEFKPVDDIHIGVISSSLGGHGSTRCPRDEAGWNNDDQGWLIPTKRTGLPDPTGAGFLAWTGEPQDPNQLVLDFAAHVEGTGEVGCGFEAPLEAWYRFLIDPQPPQQMVLDGDGRSVPASDANGMIVDGTVLAQRAAFLRPQGLVAIVVLTDENDCSAMDGGSYYNNASFGYLVAQDSYEMPIATSMCASNPNDACCFSCLQKNRPPSGCSSYAAECDAGTVLTRGQDRANVRCFQNKRRFGVDLLYPTSRYVDALTKVNIINARDGSTVPNPLFNGTGENAGKGRDSDRVFFAGIVGLPWQDVATDDSIAPGNGVMKYRTASELLEPQELPDGTSASRWEIILGNPGLPESNKACEGDGESTCGLQPVLPRDPFMVESIEPRAVGQVHPIDPNQVIVTADSMDPLANAINGHEAKHNVVGPKYTDGEPLNDDLQYACIFPLNAAAKMGCTEGDLSCDCGDEPLRNRPLCQDGGVTTNNQYYGKAYPGTRILQVLRDFGTNAIVGSICPKVTTGDPTNVNFGYNPAVQAIVDRLAEKLAGKCLPRELTIDENGSVPCSVVEARNGNEGPLDCNLGGRDEVDEITRPAVLKQLKANLRCGGNTGVNCEDWVMCTVNELTGAARNDCLYKDLGGGTSAMEAGFCYIDPAKTDEEGNYIAGGDAGECTDAGQSDCADGTNPIVANCPATERRLLRFVGNDASPTPTPNTITFVACTGDAASGSDGSVPPPPTNSGAAGAGN